VTSTREMLRWGAIWWLWTAYSPALVHVFNVADAWRYGDDEPDVYWLGECAWTAMRDNMKIGLR